MTFARGTRLRQPRRLGRPLGSNRLYALPLMLVLLLAAGWYRWPAGGKAPGSLSGYRAAGARDELNCLRLVIGVDVSGSMRDFVVPRDDALTQLFSWVKKNLRRDDQVAIIDLPRWRRSGCGRPRWPILATFRHPPEHGTGCTRISIRS